MKKEFIQLDIEAPHSTQDVIIAMLAEVGYDSFLETENGLEAYIEHAIYDEATVKLTLERLNNPEIRYSANVLPSKNWNAEWEKNYPSVFIDDFCQILPSFRSPTPHYTHSLIIDPKMSFGTGNHETTRLMIQQMKEINFKDKDVLDMGCGTAVLAILAEKLGAKHITAIDIDAWSYENASENLSLNKANNVTVILGDSEKIPSMKYDVILANINRNILLQDIPNYVQHLQNGGVLLLSGFYTKDEEVIQKLAESLNLHIDRRLTDNKWMAISYRYNL